MTLRRGDLTLRPPRSTDTPVLAAILAEPSVARWWPGYDPERVERDLVTEREDEEAFVVERGGRVMGYVQLYEETDADFRHASIDLFLATDSQGLGLGPEVIRAVAEELIDVRGHHRLTIDPAADNVAAIRAYAKVGFKPVGRLRRYQQVAPGVWIDGLLMDLLAEELVR